MTLEKQNAIFLEWVESHGAILWKIARLNAAVGEHEELYQDLLIALWKAVPLYRNQAKVSTFIYRLAFNRGLNWTRDRQTYRRRHISLDEMPSSSVPGVVSDEKRDREGQIEDLYGAMTQLPDADRSLALMYLEDLSYRDIAEILGITENNVGVKMSRLKKRLTELLQRAQATAGGSLQ